MPAGSGAGMNRRSIAANSRDAALRALFKAMQAHIIVPHDAAEEHAAELQQGPEAAIGDDPLAVVQGEDFTTEDLARELEEVARCFRWSVRRTFRETMSGRSGTRDRPVAYGPAVVGVDRKRTRLTSSH